MNGPFSLPHAPPKIDFSALHNTAPFKGDAEVKMEKQTIAFLTVCRSADRRMTMGDVYHVLTMDEVGARLGGDKANFESTIKNAYDFVSGKLKCYKFDVPFDDKNRGSVFTANFQKLSQSDKEALVCFNSWLSSVKNTSTAELGCVQGEGVTMKTRFAKLWVLYGEWANNWRRDKLDANGKFVGGHGWGQHGLRALYRCRHFFAFDRHHKDVFGGKPLQIKSLDGLRNARAEMLACLKHDSPFETKQSKNNDRKKKSTGQGASPKAAPDPEPDEAVLQRWSTLANRARAEMWMSDFREKLGAFKQERKKQKRKRKRERASEKLCESANDSLKEAKSVQPAFYLAYVGDPPTDDTARL